MPYLSNQIQNFILSLGTLLLICHPIDLAAQGEFTIGCNNWGIILGNRTTSNGVRFNVITNDYDTLNSNGLSFTFWDVSYQGATCTRTNGFHFSTVYSSQTHFFDCHINGLSLSLVSFVNRTNGLCLNLLYSISTSGNGVHFSVINRYGTWNGIEISAINLGSNFNGLQLGILNFGYVNNGLQVGLFNISNRFDGVQLGGFNFSNRGLHRGLQFGLINTSNSSTVQIGLLNIRRNNRKGFRILPIMNLKIK